MTTTTRFTWLTWALSAMLAAALVIPSTALADDDDDDDGGSTFSLAITIGEGMYLVDDTVYRSPVNLEIVPSFGWEWFKFDLGVVTRFESLNYDGRDVGEWHFAFRPGARFTPPIIPLYARVALPLAIGSDRFDTGLLVGLGLDFRILGMLGIVVEADTTLENALDWGAAGVPIELRAGVSLHF